MLTAHRGPGDAPRSRLLHSHPFCAPLSEKMLLTPSWASCRGSTHSQPGPVSSPSSPLPLLLLPPLRPSPSSSAAHSSAQDPGLVGGEEMSHRAPGAAGPTTSLPGSRSPTSILLLPSEQRVDPAWNNSRRSQPSRCTDAAGSALASPAQPPGRHRCCLGQVFPEDFVEEKLAPRLEEELAPRAALALQPGGICGVQPRDRVRQRLPRGIEGVPGACCSTSCLGTGLQGRREPRGLVNQHSWPGKLCFGGRALIKPQQEHENKTAAQFYLRG